MTFEEKLALSLAIMEKKKMWRSHYAPPLYRLLWKCGVHIPPPPFAPFWLNVTFFGVTFGLTWTLIMTLTVWRASPIIMPVLLSHALFAGLIFGLSMALFHSWRRAANRLPAWNKLTTRQGRGEGA